MKKNIILIIKYLLAVVLGVIGLFIVLKPDVSLTIVDDLLHNITGTYYFSDENEKINKDQIIKIASNKDYSNSIFYPYYELLNNDHKKIYNTLLNNINKYTDSVKLDIKVNSD